MRRQIESAAPPSFDLRSRVNRFESEATSRVDERITIEFDLPDGQAQVTAEPRELDDLFSNLVVNVSILMQSSGRLTVDLTPDEFENMPDEFELADPTRWLHLAIEDRGVHPVGTLFRRLLDPLINVAPQLAASGGALRWSGRILFDENEEEASRVIHLLLPYAAEREKNH